VTKLSGLTLRSRGTLHKPASPACCAPLTYFVRPQAREHPALFVESKKSQVVLPRARLDSSDCGSGEAWKLIEFEAEVFRVEVRSRLACPVQQKGRCPFGHSYAARGAAWRARERQLCAFLRPGIERESNRSRSASSTV
jgi:hypothetical protein